MGFDEDKGHRFLYSSSIGNTSLRNPHYCLWQSASNCTKNPRELFSIRTVLFSIESQSHFFVSPNGSNVKLPTVVTSPIKGKLM